MKVDGLMTDHDILNCDGVVCVGDQLLGGDWVTFLQLGRDEEADTCD